MARPPALTLSTILAFVVTASLSLGQGIEKNETATLVDWKAVPCDDSYNAYRLIDRITEMRTEAGVTFITVNFRDNCCAEFKPQITFRDNKLFLQPYKEYDGDRCSCFCCFSIEYAVAGIPEGGYEIYFDGYKIEVSDDPYPVVQPTSSVYKKRIINRANRYGFKEGIWMTFDKKGNITTIEKYPDSQLQRERRPVWIKSFYTSGQLWHYYGKDTVTFWFKNGALHSQSIAYTVGDTTYKKELDRYNRRQIQKRSLERSYPKIIYSEFDSAFKKKVTAREVVYHEEYFRNGKLKSRHGKDTTYAWHENGQIAWRAFHNPEIGYDTDGRVTERVFHWKTKGPTFWGDFEHSLHATIGANGKVLTIRYTRDRGDENGVGSGNYRWTWDAAGTSIESPKEWNEPLPWTRFNQLVIPHITNLVNSH
jgi:hypothetical protein